LPGRLRRAALPAFAAAVLALHGWVITTVLREPIPVPAREPSFLTGPLHFDAVRRIGPGADFFALYHAGVQAGLGRPLYRGSEDPPVTPYFYPFRYPPVAAQTLGRAFAALPPAPAYRLWVVVLEILLMILILFLWRALPAGRVRTAVCTLLLLSTPYFLELHMGQFTFATLTLAAIGLLVLAQGEAWAVGVAATVPFTAALLLKAFPLVAVPALLRRKLHVAVAVTSVLVLVLANVPHFLAHPEAWRHFSEANLEVGFRDYDSGNHGFTYLIYVLARALGVDGSEEAWANFNLVWRLLALGGVSLVVLAAQRAPVVVGGAAMLFGHFLTYPHVWEHHASGILVAGALLVVGLVSEEDGRLPRVLLPLALLAMTILALPTPFALLGPRPGLWSLGERVVLPLSKAVPTALLLGVAVAALLRPGRQKKCEETWPRAS